MWARNNLSGGGGVTRSNTAGGGASYPGLDLRFLAQAGSTKHNIVYIY